MARRPGSIPPPAGWEIIEHTLGEIERNMREGIAVMVTFLAEIEPHETKRIAEASWPIFRLHHLRSRYIYEMYYCQKAISEELYKYCLREKIADAALIAKWKKQGYERLCCLRCIQPADMNYGTTCICRVPRSKIDSSTHPFQCQLCGCRGCSG